MKWLSLSLFAILAAAESDVCLLPLDVMFLQDTTGSQESIIGTMIRQIPLVYAGISSRFPESHFGVAEFKDKPYMPLGLEDGFCYKLAAPMTMDMATVVDAYSWLYASGGGDIPEAQYQAIINAALDPAVGWRRIYDRSSGDTTEETIAARVIIMLTDAVPHLNGDMAKFADYPTVPQGLPENSGIISTDDINYECLFQEYPSPEQLKAALKSTNTSLIILTPEDPAIIPAWTWVNSDLLGQPSSFYHRPDVITMDLFQDIVGLLDTFSLDIPCPTTAAPTAAVTTTRTAATTTVASTSPISTLTATSTIASETGSSTATAAISSPETGNSTLPQCTGCPCVSPGPCAMCPLDCNQAVVVRLAKEPKKMQVIVNNE